MKAYFEKKPGERTEHDEPLCFSRAGGQRTGLARVSPTIGVARYFPEAFSSLDHPWRAAQSGLCTGVLKNSLEIAL